MKLEILQIPECPNAAILESRLSRVLADHPLIEISRHVVTSEDQARRLGMTGSPTLLIDGADPFARPGQQSAYACRIYFDDSGCPAAAPSETQLREAISAGRSAT